MMVFKVITILWPFLKEMILRGKGIKESMRTNKRGLALVVLFIASIALNMHILGNYIEHVRSTDRSHDSDAATTDRVPKPPPPLVRPTNHPDEPDAEDDRPNHYQDLKSYFDTINQQEQKERY